METAIEVLFLAPPPQEFMHSETVFVVFDTTNTVRKKYRKVLGGGRLLST